MMTELLRRLADFGGRRPRCARFAARLHWLLGGNVRRVAPGNVIDAPGAYLRRTAFLVSGTGNKIQVLDNARVANTIVRIEGDGHHLVVGPECVIKSMTVAFQGDSGLLSVGAETTIEDAHLAVTESSSTISIGTGCMLAFGVDVRCGDSHGIFDRATRQRLNPARNIHIGDHVWLAAHTEVLKGVTIGSGSVIGIRSVVTHDVPPNVVACGNPAKVVRENIVWERQLRAEDVDPRLWRASGSAVPGSTGEAEAEAEE